MLLIVDNFDSFTYNLVDYFKQLGQEITVIRNLEAPENIVWDSYDGIVLSPGPGKPQEANALMRYLACIPKNKPVLGICLGHQAIGEHYGATLSYAQKPMHGKLSVVEQKGHPLFKNIPQKFNVVRYHSLVLTQLPDDLEAICSTETGELMALAHKTFPIYGIQFHPESVLTEYGMKLLENWLILNNIQAKESGLKNSGN